VRRSGSPLIELIIGVFLTAGSTARRGSTARSAAGLALSRQIGTSVTPCTRSISHSRSSGSRSGCVPALTSIQVAPAAACFCARFWINAASRSAMALATALRVPLIFSAMILMRPP